MGDEKNDPEIQGHLPDVICSLDFPEFSTDIIRKALGIYDLTKAKRTRIPRVLVFPQYYPITELFDDTFWKIFWQCFRCGCFLLYFSNQTSQPDFQAITASGYTVLSMATLAPEISCTIKNPTWRS